jgi:hypothetical protein
MATILTETPTRGAFDTEINRALDDEDVDYSGWHCVATDEFPCPATDCDYVAQHMTAAHRIIVWPERDDRMLLHHASLAQRVGRNPRVVEYEVALGPCIAYDQWEALGFPVHGLLDRPEGWPE